MQASPTLWGNAPRNQNLQVPECRHGRHDDGVALPRLRGRGPYTPGGVLCGWQPAYTGPGGLGTDTVGAPAGARPTTCKSVRGVGVQPEDGARQRRALGLAARGVHRRDCARGRVRRSPVAPTRRCDVSVPGPWVPAVKADIARVADPACRGLHGKAQRPWYGVIHRPPADAQPVDGAR